MKPRPMPRAYHVLEVERKRLVYLGAYRTLGEGCETAFMYAEPPSLGAIVAHYSPWEIVATVVARGGDAADVERHADSIRSAQLQIRESAVQRQYGRRTRQRKDTPDG